MYMYVCTSSSVLKGTIQMTGPNISSVMSLLVSGTLVMTVGRRKYPCTWGGMCIGGKGFTTTS